NRLKIRLGASPNEMVTAVGLLHIYAATGQIADAVSLAEKISIPPDDANLKFMANKDMAMTFYLAKKYDQSEACFKAALEISANDVECLNNYAYMLTDGMKQHKRAIEIADKALKILESSASPNLLITNFANVTDTYGWALYNDKQNEPAMN